MRRMTFACTYIYPCIPAHTYMHEYSTEVFMYCYSVVQYLLLDDGRAVTRYSAEQLPDRRSHPMMYSESPTCAIITTHLTSIR